MPLRTSPLPTTLPRAALAAGSILLAGLHSLAAAAVGKAEGVDGLAAAARGVLARRCFSCHGESRLSGLDLRTLEGALKGGARGPALVPGKPEASRLYLTVSGRDPLKMPPAGPLPPAERDLLRRWIGAGAPVPGPGSRVPGPAGTEAVSSNEHWAFRPIRNHPVPVIQNPESRIQNPIDAFVLKKLQDEGLSLSPPAGRRELIRRVTFDLTGLPPTPGEVREFLADSAPDAYERLVDRLLASPRYGERQARHWLDVVRFAESQGFERDKIREHAWRYRDYVIRAFNEDRPYDRFVREQIAGDALPDATAETIAATGFLVGGPWDEVGASQPSAVMKARVREDELEDIVSATAQTFLGLTVNCARCHDHKFDPIPQKDYYRFQAALAGVRHGDRLLLTDAEKAARDAEMKRLKEQIGAVEGKIAAVDAAGRKRVRERLAAQPRETAGAPAPLARWTFEGDGRDSVGALHAELSGAAKIADGRLVLDGKDSSAKTAPLPGALAAKTLEAWVVLASPDQRGGGVVTVEDAAGRVFDAIVYGERQPKKWTAGSNFFYRTKDLTAADEDTPAGGLVHLAITYAPDHRITLYRNGVPYGEGYVPADNPEAELRTFPAGGSRVLFGLRHSAGMKPGGDRWLKGELEEARLYDRALGADEVAASFRGGPPTVSAVDIQAALTDEERAARKGLEAELEQARAALRRAEDAPRAYAANPEKPGKVHLLLRGDVGKKGDEVTPGGLSCLPGLPADFGLPADAPDGERRLKLAEWITHPANPLTPRVIVNRVWQSHFGRGLVASPSDFGASGEPPTHPELLDWLAATFVAVRSPKSKVLSPESPVSKTGDSGLRTQDFGLGWSLKRLHRLIVTSSTYRQSSQPAAPDNSKSKTQNPKSEGLLGRVTPRRLEAEEVRDAMLAVSGQLNPEVGGPGFRPFNVTISNTHFYTYEDRMGPEYNRRSIYRTVVNSGGVPLLEAFDCPDPSVKTPRRAVTTTPQQALALLNSSFVLRQAKEFAARLEREAGTEPARQVSTAYEYAFGRLPNAAEGRRGIDFVRRHGLRAFCRALFSAGEFVYVR